MNISVDFIGIVEMQETKKYNMSKLAFIKHLAIAEQGYLPSLHKLIRTLSRFVLFSPFLKKEAFRDNRFSEPNFFYNDNEPKRLFPGLAGLAFADYLSKRIDKSIFSISFDALHSNSPRSQRVLDPDLLCFSNQFVFGIESKFKNYSRNSRNWSAPQNQIDLNLLNINYLVFAVTYNVYR